MKAKFLDLTWPQRVLLLMQVFLVILFLILYLTLGRQQVIKYEGSLFRYQTQGDTAVYSGKLNGQKAAFTVSPGPVVEFRVGNTLYGPYTITEDPTAVPQEHQRANHLTGVEVRRDGQLWFRGAFDSLNSFPVLYGEDGSIVFSGVEISYGQGETDLEPAVHHILRIALKPNPVPRGYWVFFWLGILFCAFCVLLILFADNLFRWNLRFVIRDPENAEPADWVLFTRWLGWIIITIATLVLFIKGLNAPTL